MTLAPQDRRASHATFTTDARSAHGDDARIRLLLSGSGTDEIGMPVGLEGGVKGL
jgi:hypothetical protein